MHYFLFTGHMIDKTGRSIPRFPASKEPLAKAAIKKAIESEIKLIKEPAKGIAGGACGGDTIFHEVCEELGIETELYLALPKDEFIEASVEFGGTQWVDRFNRLYEKLPNKELSQASDLPEWLQDEDAYSVWERSNLWMLESALKEGGNNTTLIALWDGKGGDGVGGTEHMVKEAAERGAKTIIIDTKKEFEL
jgi:hypothetical protein